MRKGLNILLAVCFMMVSTMAMAQYKIGDVVDDFSLKSTTDKMVSLASYPDAKGYVIIFTCNTCPYAVLYEDRIGELHSALDARGYKVIAINSNDPAVKAGDSFDEMVKRAGEKSIKYDYIVDDQELFKKFGAKKTPEVYVLDADKKIRYRGAIDDNPQNGADVSEQYVNMAIDALEKGEEPSPTKTKAIGCSIKVKK